MLPQPFVALTMKQADGGRRDTKMGQPVFFDQLPETARVGPIGGPFEQENRRALKGHSDDFPRSHHPPKVGEPEEPVVRLHVHKVRELPRDLRDDATVRMQGALGPSRGPRGINNKTKGFRIESLRGSILRRVPQEFVPPHIALPDPWNLRTGAPENDACLHRRHGAQSLIRERLQRQLTGSARRSPERELPGE